MRYSQALSEGELKRLPRLLRGEFPRALEESDYRFDMEVGVGSTPAMPKPHVVDKGYKLFAKTDEKFVIARGNSIALVYMAPYPGWDVFVQSADFVFNTIRAKLGFRPVNRIGLRYINRLDVPLRAEDQGVETAAYLRMGVGLPDIGLIAKAKNFQGIVDVDLPQEKLWARVQAATTEPALIGYVSLVLDIDLIADQELPRKEDELWILISRMREVKNTIFENCVTDASRKLFGAPS